MRTPLVPVGHLDLSQTDKSLNPAILNLWPSGTILEVKTWRDGNGGERAHLADRLLALHCAATSLSVLCFRSFHVHRDLKRIEPFSNMEARLDRYRRRADSLLDEQPLEAAQEYFSALTQLYPWCSTPLLFRRDDAFALGIAQLDSGCWSGLASALLILDQHETASLCAHIVKDMRYAAPAARIRAKSVLRAISQSH